MIVEFLIKWFIVFPMLMSPFTDKKKRDICLDFWYTQTNNLTEEGE